MKEVFVDVGKHAGRGLERVVGGLETGFVGAVLERGMAGEDGGDVEDDGGLFKRKRELRRCLMCERIKPVGWRDRLASWSRAFGSILRNVAVHEPTRTKRTT